MSTRGVQRTACTCQVLTGVGGGFLYKDLTLENVLRLNVLGSSCLNHHKARKLSVATGADVIYNNEEMKKCSL